MSKSTTQRRGSGLAQRLRANIDRKQAAARVREESRLRALEMVRKERRELMVDLAAFAEAVGFVVERKGDGLVWRQADVWLRFDASGDDNRVTLAQEEGRPVRYTLAFEAELSKWVLNITRKNGAVERLMLFDAGLEYLVYNIFDLEAVAEADLPTDR